MLGVTVRDPLRSPKGTCVPRLFAALIVAAGVMAACSAASPAAVVSPTISSKLIVDACSLIDDATAGLAMGTAAVPGTAPQRPSDVASRCEWRSGIYSLSLLVRRGADAKSSFDNLTAGFTANTVL